MYMNSIYIYIYEVQRAFVSMTLPDLSSYAEYRKSGGTMCEWMNMLQDDRNEYMAHSEVGRYIYTL